MIDVYSHLQKTKEVLAQSAARLERAGARFGKDHTEFARDLALREQSLVLLRTMVGRGRQTLETPAAPSLDAEPLWVSDDSEYDALTVELEAHRLIKAFGSGALTRARESAELADERGDMLDAEAWRDIADEAQRILGIR